MALSELELRQGDVSATLVPERGAIVTALTVAGREVLYLDRSTLEDTTKSVRGGIPILFPFAGKLAGDRLLAAGTSMKQHGFGRNKPWLVKERRADFVRLALSPDAETRARYPYAFEVDYGVQLLPRGLQVELLVENQGARALPLAPGWHPYFRCPGDRKGDVQGDVAFLSSDALVNDREVDFGIEAPVTGRARFEVPGLGALRLAFSPEMRHLQLWSQPAKDFLCIEPFWGPNDTINTPARLEVAPGQARALWMRIELD